MQPIISQHVALFQALSDESRLRIFRLLVSTQQEACLCELVDSLLEPKYKLSRHLKIMRQAGLLKTRKEGRWVYHRLIDTEPHLTRLASTVGRLPDPESIYAMDLVRFEERMALRHEGCCCTGIQNEALA